MRAGYSGAGCLRCVAGAEDCLQIPGLILEIISTAALGEVQDNGNVEAYQASNSIISKTIFVRYLI